MKDAKRISWVLVFAFLIFSGYSCSQGPVKARIGPDGYDAVVVGAGGGGMAAAAKLALGGLKVLVIEQHDKVGGFMSAFERNDYRFEVSLHAMDGMGIEAFDDLGIDKKVRLHKTDPAYRSVFPDAYFDIPADAEKYRQLLKEKFPAESKGIDKLWKDLHSIDYIMNNLMNLEAKKNIGSSLLKILTSPCKLWILHKFWTGNSTDTLGAYIKDPKLFTLFTQLMAYTGIDPDNVSGMLFAMMWVSYHFHGFYYFEGGSQAVTKALAEVVQEHGGKVLLNTLVTRIVMKDGLAVAVQTKDGKEFPCRYVVSNANAPDTFFKLVGREYLPQDYAKNLDNMKIGASAYAVYLGVNKDLSGEFPPGIHSYFVNPGWDQAETFRYFREGIPEKAMFGLINYTMADPTDAPKGKNVIALVSMMPYDYKGDWLMSQGYDKYKALKEEVAQKFIERGTKLVPSLKSSIELMEVGTPKTMERYTLNPKGTIFGWEYSINQSMFKRLPQKTPIDNLYLAGAWTFPGGGQSAVLLSGLETAKMILKREGK
ncbi:MAG: NAD(P)/FAD-dependent oxidoreductase [bacterium]|nr:NAD(P)/FAD-dependent oxidoreductase [bacterium]